MTRATICGHNMLLLAQPRRIRDHPLARPHAQWAGIQGWDYFPDELYSYLLEFLRTKTQSEVRIISWGSFAPLKDSKDFSQLSAAGAPVADESEIAPALGASTEPISQFTAVSHSFISAEKCN